MPAALSSRRVVFTVVLVLFFLSGASGLVYEVIWVRMLSQVFGSTHFALAAVLTSFMAGLGLGSFLAGRYLSHRRDGLLLFGAFECGVGLYGVLLPRLLPLAERAFLGAIAGLEPGLYGESLLKLLLSLALLVPPTALMGASLPLVAQHVVVRLSHLGVRVGSLYALNTLGAMAGCFLAGFFAIRAWGIAGTTLAAAAVNLAVGVAAIALGRARAEPLREEKPVTPEAVLAGEPSPYSRAVAAAALAAFFFSGFAALGLEVVWTRLITLVLVGFTYSFTIMLTVFLAGIALGSLALARTADRSRDLLTLQGLVAMASGVATLVTAPLFVDVQAGAHVGGLMLGGAWEDHTLARFVAIAILLLPPTFFFGATFPVVSRLAARELSGLGFTVGRLYSANVAGSIAGAFVTGFVLIPLAGSDRSLKLLSFGLVGVGATLVYARSRAGPSWARWAPAAGMATAVAAISFAPPDVSFAIHQSWLAEGETMSFYKEGASATVMVAEYAKPRRADKRLVVTGSSASNSTYYGLSVNRLQGVLPFLFERTPRRVLAICFGTGITFGTLTEFDVERVDGVDISPEVFEAAPRFAAENYDVLSSARARLHVDDGRNFLLKSVERYDAITMEPMAPALAGVVHLYTREFYRLCRAHLEAGGVVSQWVPLYFVGPEDVRMLYRTFAESFPYAVVFSHNFDTFLVGSDRPLDLSAERTRRRLTSARLARDLEAIELGSPERLLGRFLMGRDAMLRFAGPAPVLTDDRPVLEFTAARTIDLSTLPGNFRMISEYAEPPDAYVRDAEPDRDRLRATLGKIFHDEMVRRGRIPRPPLAE